MAGAYADAGDDEDDDDGGNVEYSDDGPDRLISVCMCIKLWRMFCDAVIPAADDVVSDC